MKYWTRKNKKTKNKVVTTQVQLKAILSIEFTDGLSDRKAWQHECVSTRAVKIHISQRVKIHLIPR